MGVAELRQLAGRLTNAAKASPPLRPREAGNASLQGAGVTPWSPPTRPHSLAVRKAPKPSASSSPASPPSVRRTRPHARLRPLTSPSGPAGQAGAESPTPSTEEADHEHPHRVSDGCHQEERRSQALPGGDLDELLQELIAAGLNLPGCAAIADCHQGAIEGHPDIRFERVSDEFLSQLSARLACDDPDEMAAEGAPTVQWLMEIG